MSSVVTRGFFERLQSRTYMCIRKLKHRTPVSIFVMLADVFLVFGFGLSYNRWCWV